MGTWGADAFGNDTAWDWVAELKNDEDGSVIIEALSGIVALPLGDQPEDWECCNALAAAEVMASARGNGTGDLPREASVWVAAHGDLVDAKLLTLASRAVKRILIDSELKDLWIDEGKERWNIAVSDLVARLR